MSCLNEFRMMTMLSDTLDEAVIKDLKDREYGIKKRKKILNIVFDKIVHKLKEKNIFKEFV